MCEAPNQNEFGWKQHRVDKPPLIDIVVLRFFWIVNSRISSGYSRKREFYVCYLYVNVEWLWYVLSK